MNIAITGATGFIGRGLLNSFQDRGLGILTVGRGIEPESLSRTFQENRIDAVVHLASLFVSDHRTDQITDLVSSNILYGTQILEAARLAGVTRFVNAGTAWQTFHTNHDSYRAVSLYAATKQAFEDILAFYADSYAMRAVTLRIFDTYGVADSRPKLIPKLFESARDGKRMELAPGEQMLDLLFAEDLNAAFITALEQTAIGDFGHKYRGVSGGQPATLKEIVKIVEKVTGKTVDAAWGARPYRSREVMKPTAYPKLENWEPKFSLEAGFTKVWDSIN